MEDVMSEPVMTWTVTPSTKVCDVESSKGQWWLRVSKKDRIRKFFDRDKNDNSTFQLHLLNSICAKVITVKVEASFWTSHGDLWDSQTLHPWIVGSINGLKWKMGNPFKFWAWPLGINCFAIKKAEPFRK